MITSLLQKQSIKTIKNLACVFRQESFIFLFNFNIFEINAVPIYPTSKATSKA